MGDWVPELERCWRRAASSPVSERIIVEFRDVRFVSDEGLRLLRQMAEDGAELMASDLMMKAIVEEIAGESVSPLETDSPKELRK